MVLNLCVTETIKAGHLGLRNQQQFEETGIAEDHKSWDYFVHVSTENPVVSKLGNVEVSQMVLVLKASKGHGEQLRLGTIWQGQAP